MKQCAQCAKKYYDSNPACPRCYSAETVAVVDTSNSSAVFSTAVTCPQCGSLVEGGTANCPQCEALVAPIGLKLLIFAGLLGAPLLIAFLLYIDAKDLWNIESYVLCAAAMPIMWGLLHANQLSWLITRWLLWGSLGTALAMALISAYATNDTELMQKMTTMAVLRLFGVIPIWFYLNSRDVKEFFGIETV
ncbi:MAG: hypothetical protein ACYDBB_22985 [Armatimonadota bacterium]